MLQEQNNTVLQVLVSLRLSVLLLFLGHAGNIAGGERLLPLVAVKLLHLDLPGGRRVEAVRGDTVAVWVGPRDVEWLHAAGGAEGVLGAVRVEGVGGERVVAAQQLELTQRHHEVLVLLLDADAAVAVNHGEGRRRIHFEPDGAAVTPALVVYQVTHRTCVT